MNLGFARNPGFCPTSGFGRTSDSYGEQVRTSKAGNRATGESRDTCRTRVHPDSATSEGKAGAIAACSHVLPQAQNRQRCEKRLIKEIKALLDKLDGDLRFKSLYIRDFFY